MNKGTMKKGTPARRASEGHPVQGAVRPGFTIVELTAALAILAIVMVLIVQAGYGSLRERSRSFARQTALELADNVLESARARPWSELTPKWGDAQKLPKDAQTYLPEGQLIVRVEPDKSSPQTRRVTVEVRWNFEAGSGDQRQAQAERRRVPPQAVKLVTLVSDRSAAGGKR